MYSSPLLKRLTGKAAAVVLSRLVGIASNVLLTLILARTLPEGELRDYSLFISFLSVGAIFAAFGQNEAALRFIAEHLSLGNLALSGRYWRAARMIALCSSLVAAALVCGFLAIDDWRLAESIRPFILYLTMFGGVALLAWQMVAAESLRGYQQVGLASLFSGGLAGGPISSFLLLLVTTGMAVTGTLTLERVLLAYVGAIAITLPIPLYLLQKRSDSLPSSPSSSTGSEGAFSQATSTLLSVGSVLMLTQLLSYALQSADLWVGGALLQDDKESLDYYYAAKRLVLLIAMPVQMATLTVISSIPDLYAQRKLSELQKLLQTTALIAAIPSLIAALPLLIAPEWTLSVILKERFVAAAPCLQILVIGYIVLVVTGNPQQALTMTGYHRVAMAVNLIACGLLFGLGYWMTQHWGIKGLAFAATVSLSAQNLLLWGLARRLTGVWTHVTFFSFFPSKEAVPSTP